MKEKIRVLAVYGTLRLGMNNNRLLQESAFFGTTRVAGIKLYHAGLPFAVCEPENPDASTVVDLYWVNAETLERIDQLEQHPSWYQRVKVSVENLEDDFCIAEDEADIWVYCVPKKLERFVEVPDGDFVKYWKGVLAA